MFDFELLRRLSSGAAPSEDDVARARAARDYEEPANLEAARPRHTVPVLTDGQVAALISREARDAVIGYEVTSQRVYERRYVHPEAPAGQSGITVGIGYDLGYNSPDDVRRHWQGSLPQGQIDKMVTACGIRGDRARASLADYQDITVPWAAAVDVYQRSTMPRFGRMVLETFPNAIDTQGHAFGALFSLIFNRGSSLEGDSRTEMRAIRDLMERSAFDQVPAQFIAMKHIWDGRAGFGGVLARRDAEAILFTRGLELMGKTPALAAGSPRSVPSATMNESVITTGSSEDNEASGGFDPKPVVAALMARSQGRGGQLEAGGGAQACVPQAAVIDDWHYQLGLYESAARSQGRPIHDGNLESFGAAQLEFGTAALKKMGGDLARDLEFKLRDYICKQAAMQNNGIRTQIDDASASGVAAIRTILIKALCHLCVLVPSSLIEPIVDVMINNVVTPNLGPNGHALMGQVGQGCDWLCQQWGANIDSRTAPGGLMPTPPKLSIEPILPQDARPPAPVANDNARIADLIARMQVAAASQPNGAQTQRYLTELNEEIGRSGAALSTEQTKTLLAVLSDPRLLLQSAAGIDLVPKFDAIKALVAAVPINTKALDGALDGLHRDLSDARLALPADAVKPLLKALKNARQFDHLSRLADRLVTRDRSLLPTISVPYAQGLIDSGRIVAGIEVLTSAAQGRLTPDDAAEVDGLLGRAHKQIYLNFVRTQTEAMALAKEMGPHLTASMGYYAQRYVPAHPGDTFYHGINLVALLKRAKRDGLATDPKLGDANEIARAIIAAIQPAAVIGNDRWQIATLGEAYLAIGDLENAAIWYARFAKSPDVTAFELNSAIRQLEQVWQLDAAQTGAGAILTGLKSLLAQKDGGSVTLRPVERQALANAKQVQFEEHFETRTPNGDFISFGLLKQIVLCGNAVAAVQKPSGTAWENHGTAFLVAGRDFSPTLKDDRSYLLTNAHVMWDFDKPGDGGSVESASSSVDWQQVRIVFESHQIDGRSQPYECAGIVWQSSSARHDAVLFELREAVPRDRAMPLTLTGRDDALRVEQPNGPPATRLCVLGHPGGRELAISFVGSIQQNRAVLVDKGPKEADGEPVFLHYSTPTEPGNSGSPVLSADTWRVVALHHAGYDPQGRPKLNGTPGNNLANEGVSIESIRVAVRDALTPKPEERPKWWNKARPPQA